VFATLRTTFLNFDKQFFYHRKDVRLIYHRFD